MSEPFTPAPVANIDHTKPIFAGILPHGRAWGNHAGTGRIQKMHRQHHADIDAAMEYVTQQRAKGEVWWHTDAAAGAYLENAQRYLESVRTIRAGWPEGSQDVLEIASEIAATLPDARKVYRKNYREAGAFPVVARALAGDPRCMVNAQRAKGGSRVITLLVDCNAGHSTTAQAMKGRAAACLAVADTVEKAGWRCEIIAFEVSPCGSNGPGALTAVEIAVRVKDAAAPVDPLRIAYPLGHPDFLRSFLFTLDGANRAQLADFRAGGTQIGVIGTLPASLPTWALETPNTYYIRNATQYAHGDNLNNPALAAAIAASPNRAAFLMAHKILDDLKAQGCPALAGDNEA